MKATLTKLAALLVLFAFWLVLSGHYTVLLLLLLGGASALTVTCLSSRMKLIGTGQYRLSFCLRFPRYAAWLLWQIVLSNIDVARRVLHPKLPINPRFIDVESKRRNDLMRLVHANSITLTPGTVSADIEDTSIRVHALSAEAADNLSVGLERKLRELEGNR